MSQTLELIIKARDEASAKLKGLSTSVLQLGAAMAGALTGAIMLVKKAWDDVLVPLINFNREILNTSVNTGMAVEDFGRLVEVADDMGISMESLSSALEMATKRGFDASLPGLKGMAENLSKMTNPLDRATYLSDIFGKNWAVLEPILRKGGRALQVLVDGVQDGIAPTAEFIRETEELSGRIDVLSERAQVLKNDLLSDLVPAFMEAADWSARFLNNFFGISSGPFISDMRVVADVLREVGTGAGDAADDVKELTQRQYYQMAATALLAGDTAAAAFYQRLGNAAGAAADAVDRLVDAMMRSYGQGVADADIGLIGDLGMGAPARSTGQWQPFHSNDPGLAGYTQRKYYNSRWIYQAQGGEIGTGGEFVVGEHGAERFTPSTPGTISPNNDSLAQAINRMVRTLPTVITDAIERSK